MAEPTKTAEATSQAGGVKIAAEATAATATQATASETKTAEVTTDAAKVDNAVVTETKDAKNEVVPEKYELKAPKDSLLDAAEIAQVETKAKALGLSKAQAQALLEERQEAKSVFAQAQKDAFKKHQESWLPELEADKEFGGANFKESAENAKRFVDLIATDAEKKILNDKETRWGDNPVLFRLFARAGKRMANDKLVTEGKAGTTPTTKKSRESILYPTHDKPVT